MDSTAIEYIEFLKKVKRTIYLDNISPNVTESVLKAAFNQFGSVKSVQFIPVSMQPNGVHAVLVEMESRKQAKDMIAEMSSHTLMIGGMPRPVRAKAAETHMFGDRPRKPGRQITCRWLDTADPDHEVAMKIKKEVKRHAEEAAFLLQKQVEKEENLAKTQSETLKVNQQKLNLLEGVFADGTAQRLQQHYQSDI